MEGMPPLGDPLAYTWSKTAYLYPPGAIVLFMPLAQLAYRGIIPLDAAANAMVVLFGLAAVWSATRLWLEGARRTGTFDGAALWFVLGASLLVHALGWALHGQYDAVVVALLVLAGTRRSPAHRLLFLGLAFFLKFQALLCLPFFAHDLWLCWRDGRARIWRSPAVLAGLLLAIGSVSVAACLGVCGFLSPVKQTPFHVRDMDLTTGACLLFTAAFALAALVRGRLAAAGTATWILAAFASLSLVQGWYVVYFYPPALFVERRSQSWVAVWGLGMAYLLHLVPNVYRVVIDLLVLYP